MRSTAAMTITLLPVILVAIFGALIGHKHTFAQGLNTWRIEVEGVPVWITIIQAEGTASPSCHQWWECGNTRTDAYLFAIGEPGNVQLILDFDHEENEALRAKLYVAEDKTRPISYAIVGSEVKVLNAGGLPYLVLEAIDDRWISQTGPSFNLDMSIDGAYNKGEYGNPGNLTDGIVDFSVRVRADESGVPVWQTISVVNDPYTPAQRGWPRFIGWLRMPDAPEFRLQAPFMPTFPLFGIGTRMSNWFRENPLPITLDLTSMEIRLRPFVSFHIGGTYTVNSISPPPSVNFEAPFAFYGFDPESRQAHLVVRGGYSSALAPLGTLVPSPRTGVRYSWKTEDDQQWQYGFQLSDFHAYEDTLMLGDTEIEAVSPEYYPRWVMSKPWRAVTFVEAIEGYPGSEGIYFYATEGSDWLWLSGYTPNASGFAEAPLLQETAQLTARGGQTLPAGFRGEYRFAHAEPPELYLSPVDGMLHLSGAQGGIWYLGDGVLLRTADLDGDGVLDAWTREIVPAERDENGLLRATPGEVTEALYDLGNYLVHAGPEGVTIMPSNHPSKTLTLAPPTDKESWEAFRTTMRPFEAQRRDPTDLHSWLDAFSDTRLHIAGASATHVRLSDAGFRFELYLEPGFQLTGNDFLAVGGLSPADYVVEYDNDTFVVTPLIPAQLILDVHPDTLNRSGSSLQVAIINAGSGDAIGLTLIAEAQANSGMAAELARMPVQALAGQTTRVLLDVPSTSATVETLRIRLEDHRGRDVAVLHWSPQGEPIVSHRAFAAGLGENPFLLPLIGLLAFLAAMTALLAAGGWREQPNS